MALYTESYYYDQVGNIQTVKHAGSSASTPGWTRTYTYAEPSPLQPGVTNNRLTSTSVGSTISQYSYNGAAGLSGCMTSMPHLSVLNWGFNAMIQATATQIVNSGTPETTYFQYDAGNGRTRKVTNRQAAAGATPVRKSERIYMGPFEIYREFAANGTDITLERQSYNLTDGTRRVVLAETRTIGDASSDPAPQQLLRYQFTNHLDSSCLELDASSAIISYEEYTALGSSSYRTTEGNTEVPKRYRYASKERDDETGFYDYGARCYAPWLGRWISADPSGVSDGFNVYSFVRNNPIMKGDPTGTEAQGEQQSTSWYDSAKTAVAPYARGFGRGVVNAGIGFKNMVTTREGALALGVGVLVAVALPEVALGFAIGYAAGRIGRAIYDVHENPTVENKERVGEVFGEETANLAAAVVGAKIGGAGAEVFREDLVPALAKASEAFKSAAEGFKDAVDAVHPQYATEGGPAGAAARSPAEASPLELQAKATKSGGGGGASKKASGGAKPTGPQQPRLPKADQKIASHVEKLAERVDPLIEEAKARGTASSLKHMGVKEGTTRLMGHPDLAEAARGTAAEKILSHLIKSSGELRLKVKYISNVRNQGQLFGFRSIGKGRFDFTFKGSTGRWIKIEFTTRAAWLAHHLRPGYDKGVYWIFHGKK
jgi:RHS repeat-associated protein